MPSYRTDVDTADLISSTEVLAVIERVKTPRQLCLARLAFLRARHMEGVDPRLVIRYRRWKGVCLGCGAHVKKVILCAACRASLAYCPACESLYPRRASLPARCSSEYCQACVTRLSQGRRGGDSRERYNEHRQERRRALLPQIIECYHVGMEYQAIGDVIGLTPTQVEWLIRDARERGEWPAELRRRKHATKNV